MELNITQYKGYSSVDAKLHPNSGMKYPYENIINFISNLPSGFRGCFVCVKEYHYRRYDCPQGTWSRDDYEKNQKFILNLWTHKPWKKNDSIVWCLRLSEKIKDVSVQAFNTKQTKQDHYVPLTIISIHGTPLPSKHGYRQIGNTPA